MIRQPVSSTDIRSIGYEPESKILEIEFHSGGIYQYFGVPASVYQGLMSAASHGKYFHQHVKNVYEYVKIQ